MEQRPFGWTGVSVPVIGQGTWEMERQRAASIAALRRGLDLGMTHIDTAEMYGGGKVEELVGEAIAGRRHEVFLVSKGLPEAASRAGPVGAHVRAPSPRGGRLQPVWPGEFPGEPGPGRDRPGARGDPAAGGAAVPGAPPRRLRDPEGRPGGARRGERRRQRPAADRRRDPPHQRSRPRRPAASPASPDAVIRTSRHGPSAGWLFTVIPFSVRTSLTPRLCGRGA